MAEEYNELRPEYKLEHLGQGILGKYYQEYQRDVNLVMLEPAVDAAGFIEEDLNER